MSSIDPLVSEHPAPLGPADGAQPAAAAPADARQAIIDALRAELRQIQPRLPETWASGAAFQAQLGLDSLDLIELVARVEQRYDLLVSDAELAAFVSLDALADYVIERAVIERVLVERAVVERARP